MSVCKEPRLGCEADLGSNPNSLTCLLCDLKPGARFSVRGA